MDNTMAQTIAQEALSKSKTCDWLKRYNECREYVEDEQRSCKST